MEKTGVYILLVLAVCVVGDPETWVVRETGAGRIPVILSAPHGGLEDPDSIQDRDYGCYINGACVWSHDCGQKDTSK